MSHGFLSEYCTGRRGHSKAGSVGRLRVQPVGAGRLQQVCPLVPESSARGWEKAEVPEAPGGRTRGRQQAAAGGVLATSAHLHRRARTPGAWPPLNFCTAPRALRSSPSLKPSSIQIYGNDMQVTTSVSLRPDGISVICLNFRDTVGRL